MIVNLSSPSLRDSPRPCFGDSRACTTLLQEHTMSGRTIEKKDERRVSSTALGNRESTGDGASHQLGDVYAPGRMSILQ